VRHGDPAGAAQDDIGQSWASTSRKSLSRTTGSFHECGAESDPYAPTHETRFALDPSGPGPCFMSGHL
jgi:hypothetical protein